MNKYFQKNGNRFQLLLWIFNWLPTWKTHWTDESWSGALPTWISIILKIWPQFFWFSPHTAIQSCFPCDNVGLRGSHSHCCKSGRKGERCPNKSKSPWKEITSWANLRVHARYCISYQILNTRRYHIKHFPNNNFQYVPTKGEFFSPVPPKAPNFSTKKKNNQSQPFLATGFTGTTAVIGCLRVFFLVLKLGVTSEKLTLYIITKQKWWNVLISETDTDDKNVQDIFGDSS